MVTIKVKKKNPEVKKMYKLLLVHKENMIIFIIKFFNILL